MQTVCSTHEIAQLSRHLIRHKSIGQIERQLIYLARVKREKKFSLVSYFGFLVFIGESLEFVS